MMKKKENKTDVSHLDSADKTLLIHLLQEQNNLLIEKYNRLEKKYQILEDRLAKDSSNSNKPPSSDWGGHKKRSNQAKSSTKKTTSLRQKSDKKPGGQPGHPGHHLAPVKQPDETIILDVTKCGHCREPLTSKRAFEKRQVFEMPEPKMWVTEYQATNRYCRHCHYTTFAHFPEDVTHRTQYGARAKALMIYMNQYQLLPYARASEFFETVYHHKVSRGTFVNAVNALSHRMDEIESQIKTLLTESSVIHCDETGMKQMGEGYWLHTVGTEKLTHYGLDKKRGREATENLGILPEFEGIMVHDHWKSYFVYESATHALCNAHHLRELKFLHERQSFQWARRMSELLIQINEQKQVSVKQGQKNFAEEILKNYDAAYDDILKKAQREQARHGTRDSHNLLKRLKQCKASVLLFMVDFNVPFTNNLSERDLRMNKVKQKISGCFRSLTGGKHFCRIRSVISTTKKNGKNIFDILQMAFEKIISIDDLICT